MASKNGPELRVSRKSYELGFGVWGFALQYTTIVIIWEMKRDTVADPSDPSLLGWRFGA